MFRNGRLFKYSGIAFLSYYMLYVPGAGIYRHFIRQPHELPLRYGPGSWVLITGGSDGIGRAYAHAFAQKGFNIYITSRTESKLKELSEELKKDNKVEVRYKAKDFTNAHEAGFFDDIIEETKDLDVSVLVNNIGRGVRVAPDGDAIKNIRDNIAVNIYGQAILSHEFSKRMQNRASKSAIINMSSVLGGKPTAMNPYYSANKGYNDYLSRAQSWELQDKIDMLSVRPSYVSTPMTGHKKITGTTISPEDCVSGVLDKLGHDSWTNGHWKHALLYHVLFGVPDEILQPKLIQMRST